MKYSTILCSSSAAVLVALLTQPTNAQTAPMPSDQGAQAAGAPPGLEEVIVTARKRKESLQTTPIAITAISADEAKQMNVRNFQDLRGLVPNLEVTPVATGSALNLTIRGIGQTSVQVNVDNKVGFYLDDMYIARDDGNALHFYDVASLQVLKGPQGTLFGKNTLGGAVLLDTRRPTGEFGGYVDIRVGNYSRLDTEGALNVPINDNLGARFSFRTQNEDGYIKHVLDSQTSNDTNDKSARLQLRATPTDDLTVDLLGEYNESSTNGNVSIMVGCNPKSSYQKNYNALHLVPFCTAYPILGQQYLVYGGATLSIPTDSLVTDTGARGALSNLNGLTPGGHSGPFDLVKVGTINVRMVYDINDNLSVKSITGFRRQFSNHYSPAADVPNDIYSELDHTTTEQVSQEIDLNGHYFDGALTFVAGLYYIDQTTRFAQNTGPDWIDPIGYSYLASNDFESEAVFAQGAYKVTDELALTLGVRYNYDHKVAQSSVYDQAKYSGKNPACGGVVSYFVDAFLTGAACGGYLLGQGTHSWYDFDPRVQLDYRFTPDFMAYVSFTGGYESGGFNQQLGANLGGGLVPYGRERIWNYEGGVKTEWLDHRLRVNADGFYQKYSNYQATVVVTYNGVSTRAIQNAAAVHEDGAELEIEALPISDLVIRANGAYLEQAFDEIGKGVTAFTLTSPVTTAARFQGSVAIDYTFHLPNEASLVGDLNYRWIGPKPQCTSPQGACTAPAYGLLGGRLNYVTDDGLWSGGLWVTNLLDKYYFTSVNTAGTALAGFGVGTVSPGRPREFGIEVQRNF